MSILAVKTFGRKIRSIQGFFSLKKSKKQEEMLPFFFIKKIRSIRCFDFGCKKKSVHSMSILAVQNLVPSMLLLLAEKFGPFKVFFSQKM